MAAAANAFALGAAPVERKSTRDVGFAVGIIAILCVFFLPIPAFLIEAILLGLSLDLAISISRRLADW